jgi:hypothetical protein
VSSLCSFAVRAFDWRIDGFQKHQSLENLTVPKRKFYNKQNQAG